MPRRTRFVAIVVALLAAGCTATPAAQRTGTTASASAPAPASGFPDQPADVPFPTKEWPKGPWPSGIRRATLDRVVDDAFAKGAAMRVRSVVVVHHGRLIYERYSPSPEDGPTVTQRSYSVAKSITSAAVGIMVRRNKLDISGPALVAQWTSPDDPRHAITLDNLLRMSSGLQWSEQPDLTESERTRDAAAYVANKKLAHPPGTVFNYCTGCTFVVDRALADALGASTPFGTFIQNQLFGKLGMSVTLNYDDRGTWLGGNAAYATTLDYAKFGLLYLRDGVWAGERILPEGWVQYSRTPSRANAEYGAGSWLDASRPGTFFALGALGQIIGVDPAHDLTFVVTSTDGAKSPAVGDAIMDAFAN